MNVAIFASAFYPHIGGVEELVRQMASEYKARGFNPIIITNRWPRSLPVEEIHEGVKVYRLPMRVPEGALKARVNYALTHVLIRRKMLAILKRHRIDLLHVQCVSSNGYYALLAKRALGLPLVVSAQGERTMDAAQIYQRSAFLNKTLRMLLDEANFITACSMETLDDLEKYYRAPFGSRASVVYNGVRLEDFEKATAFQHPRPYILGIGRLVSQKGFDVLINAFANANLASHDLLIAGEGPERGVLAELIGKAGLGSRAQLLGRVDRPGSAALFKGCSFFVLPSRHEPMGIVNLEAMAAGKAIIASRVGGVPELVCSGKNGLLVPADDVQALAAAMVRLAGDAELREWLGTAGRMRAQDFAWSAICDQYEQIYNGVTSPNASRPIQSGSVPLLASRESVG